MDYVSYGSPRVGNEEYSKFFNNEIRGTNLRVVFKDDPVTVMP